ncbi:unnamed protein product [Mytilus edulis]|uniref:Uncharacterized protein n=1 Tax=Mytilus edulis TaxID=6550 RepID=A0A8S3U8Y7_MYTED|nr:unnamed protein product [Mytilus edulis]
MPRIGRRRNGNGRARVPVVEAQPPERRRGRRNRAVAAPGIQDVGAVVGEVQAPLPLPIQAPLPIERQPALQGPVTPALNMESKLSQMQKWTCFICQKPPLSIESLERQEKSGVIIYIDWDYRSILRCSSCMNCFHADCANKLRMKTIIMKSKTKEGTDYKLQCTDDIAKILLSKDTDPAVKEIIVNGLMPLAQVDMHSNTSPDDMASASS